jgi:hypothetical protein
MIPIVHLQKLLVGSHECSITIGLEEYLIETFKISEKCHGNFKKASSRDFTYPLYVPRSFVYGVNVEVFPGAEFC